MSVQLNHTIVHAHDPKASAEWLAELLALPAPTRFPPFWVVETANGASLDFIEGEGDIPMEHYAFLVSDDEFDEIYGKLVERGIDHYADPAGQEKGAINHHFGGRGVYWASPDGHWLEIITVPYGGWKT